MKKYVKAQVIAKNLPTGSYAAGCPANIGNGIHTHCKRCEEAK